MTATLLPLAALALFYSPLSLPSWALLVMLLPLCLAVAVIYKAVRVVHVGRLGLEILTLFLYMLAGLAALMLAGYAIVTAAT